MSEEVLATLLNAMDIAAFERGADGSFSSVAPPPAWFGRLVGDGTFPFRGHILEEAEQLWKDPAPAQREWGPCAEVDASGREFHYTVTALTLRERHYLVFQLDTGSDRLREVLQRVREQALVADSEPGAGSAAAAARQEFRRTAEEMRELLKRLIGSDLAGRQAELAKALAARCDDLVHRVETLSRVTRNS